MGNCDGDVKMRIVMEVSGQNCDGDEKMRTVMEMSGERCIIL